MSVLVTAFLALILGVIALLHAYWAVGGLWPGKSEADLICKVFGDASRRRLPPAWVIWVVAILIGIAAVWPLLLLEWSAAQLPRPLVSGIGLALTAVFLARGGAGYLHSWQRAHTLEPFARLDVAFYSPLCLLIGAGYGCLLIGRPI
ncbi:MAG: DUF3995 domain-containing protein [Hyphomicrobiales bacterium]